MKTFISSILLSTVLFVGLSIPQSVDTIPTCGTELPEGYRVDLSQEGGLYLTAQGTIRVLVVFVRFKDDVAPHNYWPANDQVQPFMIEYVDPDMQTGSTNYANLTNYFNQMSLGTYNVIGDFVYVKTQHDRSYYGTPWPNRYLATKDVLQNVVDPLVNFADYDNWTFNSNYNHTNQPDGVVDMIVMIWRGLVIADWYLGEASLGGGGSPFTVEGGTKTIKTGYGGNSGSGFTAQSWGERWVNYNFHTPVHEYGHWLLGWAHPYLSNPNYGERNVWGMMYHSSDGICANAYERERVAWINPTPITTDIINAPINDYISTGSAYKYHPPNGSSDEYYYFENHQKLGSVYDDATSNQDDKGIFIVHQQGPYANNNNIRCKPANGQFDWNDPFTTTCWGNVLPAWETTVVNRNGYSNRDQLPKTGGGYDWLYALIDEDGEAQCGDWLHGWGLNNAFNLEYNDVFSSYSNPRSHTWSDVQNNFTMEIFDQNGSIINAKFYITNPIAGKPSKPHLGWDPRDLGRPYEYGWIYLAWGADFWDGDPIEPDYAWSELQRKIGTGSWTTIYSGPNRVWSDGSVTYDPEGTIPVYFRVRIKDTQDLWSVWSDEFNTKMMDQMPHSEKYNSGIKSKDVPTSYSLQQNFPNPFNPSTQIVYSIISDGFVSLKIYDVLGNEVTDLVNETQTAGSYSIVFNAGSLPSGIYFYKLTSGSFSELKKLILLK